MPTEASTWRRRHSGLVVLAAGVALAVVFWPREVPDPEPPGERWRPEPGLTWHWQLDGEIDWEREVDVYDVDLFETSEQRVSQLQERGVRVIAYFSAGTLEPDRPDTAPLPAEAVGNLVEGWPDERWLDIRHRAVRQLALGRLERAAEKGFDAVEPDNVQAFEEDSGFGLTAADQLAYAHFLADEAHRLGLAIGLKNDLAQAEALAWDFDFAVNEQCFQYEECDPLDAFVREGKAVFQVEYELEPAAFCPRALERRFGSIAKHEDLDAWSHDCEAEPP